MSTTTPFPADPTGILAAGKGSIMFCPAIKNTAAPTLAEINAGTNLSCILYGWDVTAEQETVERTKYCYTSVAESLGAVKYAVEAIQYDYDPQKVTETTGDYTHYAKLAPGTKGFMIDRRGINARDGFATGQVVDIYPVELGARQRMKIDPTAEGEKLRIQQTVAVVSDPILDVKIA